MLAYLPNLMISFKEHNLCHIRISGVVKSKRNVSSSGNSRHRYLPSWRDLVFFYSIGYYWTDLQSSCSLDLEELVIVAWIFELDVILIFDMHD